MTDDRFRYLPVMISRLMLSLKKAADSQQGWSLGEPTLNGSKLQSIRFFNSRKGTNGREDDITLDTFES